MGKIYLEVINIDTRSATCGYKNDLLLSGKQIYPYIKPTPKKKQMVCRFDGKPVGYIEDGILKKRVQASKHMLRIPKGWAWDKEILEDVFAEGIRVTVIHDTEKDAFYSAKIKDILEKGQEINRGYGLQVVLPLAYWEKNFQNHEDLQPKLFLN